MKIQTINPDDQFLGEASKVLCSKPLVEEGGQFYKVIKSIEDNRKNYNDRELNSLPSELLYFY